MILVFIASLILFQLERSMEKQKTYHIVTFGCQMNERDLETLAGKLENMGYVFIEENLIENVDNRIRHSMDRLANAINKVYNKYK